MRRHRPPRPRPRSRSCPRRCLSRCSCRARCRWPAHRDRPPPFCRGAFRPGCGARLRLRLTAGGRPLVGCRRRLAAGLRGRARAGGVRLAGSGPGCALAGLRRTGLWFAGLWFAGRCRIGLRLIGLRGSGLRFAGLRLAAIGGRTGPAARTGARVIGGVLAAGARTGLGVFALIFAHGMPDSPDTVDRYCRSPRQTRASAVTTASPLMRSTTTGARVQPWP